MPFSSVLQRYASAALVASAATLLATGNCCLAADVVRVEEEWELTVGVPHAGSVAPQVMTLMSPTNSTADLHVIFELNHQSQPDFVGGGLQLQIWNGELPVTWTGQEASPTIASPAEKISWTQAMTLTNGYLLAEILAGDSVTWGSFGGEAGLRTATGCTFANLNAYTPKSSLRHSRVSYANNRVISLVLKKVRVYFASGETAETVIELDATKVN